VTRALLPSALFVLGASLIACSANQRLTLRVRLGTRGLSKLSFVIAYDQNLYEKHGLDVDLRIPSPEFDGGREQSAGLWDRLGLGDSLPAEIVIDGATPMMVDRATNAEAAHEVVLASTDCIVRYHIIGRKDVTSLEALRGKRVGISAHIRTTTSFIALLLARKMGWDPRQDLSLMRNGSDLDDLRSGRVDAVVADERTFALARKEGFPVLGDTRDWNAAIAGNSVRVDPAWLEQGTNREAARRFLMASTEGLALFHTRSELALDVLARWNGIKDRELALAVYERGSTFPRKPYPCYEGMRATMELYDSNGMRRFELEDFYDDSLVRELDESGFIDSLYTSSVKPLAQARK
jgi:NitT/TauT family transport system substrate-binding protein